jgi:hypothetical protein
MKSLGPQQTRPTENHYSSPGLFFSPGKPDPFYVILYWSITISNLNIKPKQYNLATLLSDSLRRSAWTK